MLVLGLVGRARSGKSTVAEAMAARAKNKGLDVQVYDIGDMVRRYCVEQHFLPEKPREQLTKDELEVLVDTGKKMRDEEGDTFWLDQIHNQMVSAQPDVAVIPNIRYRNEAEWLGWRAGVTVRVKSLNPNGSEYISPDRNANHPSETELHNLAADYTIIARRGEADLVKELAVATFDHIYRKAQQ